MSKNYVLGAGDEIIISLWGESNSSNIETVNRDGQIFIEKIGILNLGGKTIGEAKDYIISKFSPVYSTLAGDNPRSFIDLTLGELKSINVHFVGYVNIPGVHMVHPFSNVITGLIQAGGVDIKGSLRDIKIIRNNKEVSSTDFYNYFFLGKPLEDLRLMDQDIVYVSSRKNTIPVSGKILQPGYFEILEKENLNDLINFSGGFDRKSSKFIFVYRNSVSDDDSFILKKNQAEAFKIFQGDSIYFPEKTKFSKFYQSERASKNS